MRLLLDTNVFLWTGFSPAQLSSTVQRLLEDPQNELLVSVVTAWELSIRLGQLLPSQGGLVHRFWQAHLRNLVASELPVLATHALAIYRLPTIHRDPFDRMLVAQAQVEDLVLVTNDRRIAAYDIQTLW